MAHKFKRGDLVKTAATTASAAAQIAAACTAGDQYWRAYYDKSTGLVVKANADYVWIHWSGPRSDNENHTYLNDVEYFKLVSRIDHE